MQGIGRGLILFLATGCLSGRAPLMPGTAGSGVGLVVYLGLSLLPFQGYASAAVLFVFFSVWVAGRAEQLLGRSDPPEVVIDEIAGMLITMAGFAPDWRFVLAGFVLFRIMDILKPYPAGRINRDLHGGLGIVLDDVVAGVYANAVLQAIRAFA